MHCSRLLGRVPADTTTGRRMEILFQRVQPNRTIFQHRCIQLDWPYGGDGHGFISLGHGWLTFDRRYLQETLRLQSCQWMMGASSMRTPMDHALGNSYGTAWQPSWPLTCGQNGEYFDGNNSTSGSPPLANISTEIIRLVDRPSANISTEIIRLRDRLLCE